MEMPYSQYVKKVLLMSYKEVKCERMEFCILERKAYFGKTVNLRYDRPKCLDIAV